MNCGAKTRAGHGCKLVAGFKTDHLGQGRCKFHGGASLIKHGRYSTITRPRIQALLEQFAADGSDPLDLIDELRLLRALTVDYIERYDAFTDALVAWNKSYQSGSPTVKPVQVVDISEATNFLERISRVVER